ncbi:MAG: ComEC/Rec2 family competence protein, partial [Desulfosalsimonas sp.]
MAPIGDSGSNGLSRQTPDFLYNLPIVPLLLAYTAGLITGRFTGVCPPAFLVIPALAAPSAAYILYLLIRGKSACLSPLVLFFSLGLLAVSFWQPCNFPPEKAEAFLDADRVEIRGTISKPPDFEKYRTVCILEDLRIQPQSDKVGPVPGRLRAAFYGEKPELSPGDRVSMKSRIKSFKNFNNPGGFDYNQYMADQNIWGTIYSDTADLKKLKETPSAVSRLGHKVHRFRSRLDSAAQKAGSGDSAAILSALVVGKRDEIDPELREAFNRAGAGHLLAISGLHVGIIAACSFAVFKLLFSQSKGFLLRGWTVRAAALLTILPVAAYAVISGMSPSTQRAAIMATFFLAAFILEKPYNAANTIAAAALLILAVYPPSLFSISFQLSFAAVSAIFLGLHLFSGLSDFKGGAETQGTGLKFFNRAAAFFMISVFAIAGTTPLVMYYFNQAVPAAVISNMILIPWIGFGVVPAGLISAGVFGFSSAAGTWCLRFADTILNPAVSLIRAIAEIPLASFKTPTPTTFEVILAYLIIVCICLAASRGFRGWVIALSCLAVAAAAADTGYWVYRRY